MQTLVYVINKNGNPLMPCKPAKARHLLRDGKARVIKRNPFTIQLSWDCEENTQPITLGIDKGSKFTGVCAVKDSTGEPLFQAEIKHRLDVKEKMTSRREHRRARRSRKWYRKPRFLNRSTRKRENRLPQSVKTNIDEVLRVIRGLPLSFNKIIVEDVLVDIARLNNPDLWGEDYKKSNRLDENLRLACLMRDNFTCQGLGKTHAKQLDAHHIIWRSKGGKDTITNLTTLCKKCHTDLHLGKWRLNAQGALGFQDRIAQRTMQGKNYLYRELRKLLPDLELTYGYQTAERRLGLGLDKSHIIDAFVIANGENYNDNDSYVINFRPRQTRRQYYDLPKQGKGRVRYQVNKELEGFRKGDIVKVITKDGRTFIKQIQSIYSNGLLAFPRIKGEPGTSRPFKCKILLKEKTIVYKEINSKEVITNGSSSLD